MFLTARLRFVCVFVLAFAACNMAHGHNLFVLVKPQSNGPDRVEVIFEHSPRPGKGNYNKPLLDRGKTWIKKPNEEKKISLILKEVTKQGKKFLQTETNTKGPRLIVHSCKWGIYNGRLDYFHGKYLDVSSSEDAKTLANASKLPLDIVPTIQSGALTLKVLFKGKPLANTRIWIWSPTGKEMRKTTDEKGVVSLSKLQPGTWSFATVHTLKNLTGKFEGQSYRGVMHGTSFSLRWPINAEKPK